MKSDSPPSTTPVPLLEAAERFAALGSEQRLTVVRTLVRAGEEGLTIGELGERTGVTGSTLTHHMKILAQAGLIAQAREGRRIVSTAEYEAVRDLADYLISECCADEGDTQKDRCNG
ncbi:MAG: metalloregulator ArsR/SmtB family transcription factor [Pseudomonadota bacterium]